MKPRLLDLFCGAGGCTKGYQQAGFYVVGVDIRPQPRYCGDEFYQADAHSFLVNHFDEFDVIHASPPCQGYSNGRNYCGNKSKGLGGHQLLIGVIMETLKQTRRIWVIENVIGARAEFTHSLMICGTSFGLRVQRHRLFASNILLLSPGNCNHRPYDVSIRRHRSEYLLAYQDAVTAKGLFVRRAPHCQIAVAREAMGIHWMNSEELGEAIPPAYTEWIGRQLMQVIENRKKKFSQRAGVSLHE